MANQSKKHKKHRVILPYFTKPLIYFIISLVFVLPVAFGLLNITVGIVHRAQPSFAKTIADVEADDSGFAYSYATDGNVQLPSLSAGMKVGTLECGDAGFICDVYYGANRISYRNGAGIVTTEAMPGQNGNIEVKGYAAGAFKALENLEAGDIITFTTSWGTYQYEVAASEITDEPNLAADDNLLVLKTAESKKAFANYSDQKLYVTAKCISGPAVEEVQQ